MTKVYIKKEIGRYSTVVEVSKENYQTITFLNNKKGEKCFFSTDDKDLQKAIESHKDFGKIFVLSVCEEKKDSPKIMDKKEFPEVTNLNGAVEILQKEPYRVHYSKLKDKESILKIAEENNVSFPNLVTD